MAEQVLQGQVAVVTGGGRGIGEAVSKKLAAMGAAVVVNYSKSADAAEKVAAEIRDQGGKAQALQFDVASEEEVERGMKEVVSTFGGIDILVNNAGIAIDGLIMRAKMEDWRRTIDVNLGGCFLCCRAVAKTMLKAKRGRIINISSIIGEMGNAGQAAYAASKAGMFGLTKSLAKELGSRGITVNTVAPGFIQTDMTATMNETQASELLSQIPLGKLGTVEDVAEAVAFLALPQAGYITGEILAVNGGLHM